MNAVEIEEAVSKLVEQAFDPVEFPYAFLEAFGNKPATIQRLRSTGKNTTNKSDVLRDDVVAILQRNNIHIGICQSGGPDAVADVLGRLTSSPATAKHKAKFALATDGETIHAASVNTDDPPLVCKYAELADHFGYFLELAGISTVRQIRENAFDIKATGRLNRLYVELLRNNPDWDGDQRREDLNHFFARLIFCFFAEDTGIFHGNGLFTDTVRQMSDSGGENTNFVLSEIFRAMDVSMSKRDSVNLRSWAGQFPYVNGGLFGGGAGKEDVPKFTQIARSYLLHIGSLDWTQINPDIFGSMIQAVADDEERGALGMHYTSVPNILKVLNPLFLDDLHAKLKEAGSNARKLLNLRKRLARIRVFDPACGSGNFLVIAYKQMRGIEAEINILRGEPERASDIPLTNFRGIELRHFAVEVARLALIIAEYQCDELYRGQRLALAEFLPLNKENWITHGNALRLDWLKVCPPTGTGGVKLVEDDLFQTPLDQVEMDFENEGGETYICGNPPYAGSTWQSPDQKSDLSQIFLGRAKTWKTLDYVSGWIIKAADYGESETSKAAFVATNSICQGQQVPVLWPLIYATGNKINFAHTSFKWTNLASHNAGVTVLIIGLARQFDAKRKLYSIEDGEPALKEVNNINAYLIPGDDVIVEKSMRPLTSRLELDAGSKPVDGGHLFLNFSQRLRLLNESEESERYIREFSSSDEFIHGRQRYCLWIDDSEVEQAKSIETIDGCLKSVAEMRSKSSKLDTKRIAKTPHRFGQPRHRDSNLTLIVPRVSSEGRQFLPVGLVHGHVVVGDRQFAMYDASLFYFSMIASKLHLVWIGTVCVRLEMRFSYSNVLGWNTFPVPPLNDDDKANLTRCAENILLAREAHWPATIAELYDPEKMPDDLRAAHDRNDETLERIYIGRRFKNNTERLETLFAMYTEMTGKRN